LREKMYYIVEMFNSRWWKRNEVRIWGPVNSKTCLFFPSASAGLKAGDINASMTNSTVTSKPPVTLRLVVPASQCGSLIGKGGSKIKEIREVSLGVSVRVSEWFYVCSASFCILIALCFCLQSPPKGATIPYRPKPASAPIIFAGGQVRADTILASAGNHTVLAQPQPAPVSFQLLLIFLPGLDATSPTSSHELTIPNDLIGCIIGRQGSKINEIRQMSGAQIKIANATEGSAERQVTITGSPANISLAQYLINLQTGPMITHSCQV
uniref:K Homology domain-containing protein n=1 Tax=Pavo cristatus TaxID=9049 RepID=A0A8C9LFS8_PAVCR